MGALFKLIDIVDILTLLLYFFSKDCSLFVVRQEVDMAVSLIDSKLTATPLIRVLKLGIRFDPKGAVAPKFGSKVKTIEPENLKRRTNMEVNGVPLKGFEVKIAREGGGPTGITVEKPKNRLTDELTRKVSSVRETAQKGSGRGVLLDITA
ncbi:MAG: hypothetical protein Q8Q90_00310 [bacterium]|nr:hypothetical protein [bacterium]